MNSPCEELVSIASDEAFRDYGTSFYNNGMEQSPLGYIEELPRMIGEELLPRLDRLIQLLEAQPEHPGQVPPEAPAQEQPREKPSRKVTRAARRRIKESKAKASAVFFQNRGKVTALGPTSTRKEYMTAKRRVQTRNFTTCWPEPENLFDNMGSCSSYSAEYCPKNQPSW